MGTVCATLVLLSLGAGLMQLNQDFHKLDSALGAVGNGAAAVISNLFHPSGGHGGTT